MKGFASKIKHIAAKLLRVSTKPRQDETGLYCLVGNIVAVHEFGEKHEIRKGTKHFTPGTKVYCLPAQWGDGYENIIAVGICRKSRRWITVVMPTRHITNWRAKPVFSATVLKRLRDGFENFNAQWKSRKHVEKCAVALRQQTGNDR
jgi:phage-related protein